MARSHTVDDTKLVSTIYPENVSYRGSDLGCMNSKEACPRTVLRGSVDGLKLHQKLHTCASAFS